LSQIRPSLVVHTNLQKDAVMNDESRKKSMLERMQETVRRAARIPAVSQPRTDAVDAPMRNAVRTLARQRISLALYQLRAAHSLSYEAIQERTGISPQRLWDVEYGGQRLTLDELHKLAACFQLTASDMLGIDVEE